MGGQKQFQKPKEEEEEEETKHIQKLPQKAQRLPTGKRIFFGGRRSTSPTTCSPPPAPAASSQQLRSPAGRRPNFLWGRVPQVGSVWMLEPNHFCPRKGGGVPQRGLHVENLGVDSFKSNLGGCLGCHQALSQWQPCACITDQSGSFDLSANSGAHVHVPLASIQSKPEYDALSKSHHFCNLRTARRNPCCVLNTDQARQTR